MKGVLAEYIGAHISEGRRGLDRRVCARMYIYVCAHAKCTLTVLKSEINDDELFALLALLLLIV